MTPVDQADTVLTLFVAGNSERSQTAVAQFDRLRQRNPQAGWLCHVIDMLEHRDLAHQHGIVVTPTLVREAPLPIRKLVGDFSDLDEVLIALGLG